MENYGNKIVQDNIMLYLDVANKRSYPGSGNTWYDMAQGLKFTSVNTQTPLETKDGALSFAFNNSGYWRCTADYQKADFGDDYTLIMWLYDEGIGERDTIFEKAGTSYQSYEQEIAVTWEVDNRLTWYSRRNTYDYGNMPIDSISHNAWTMTAIKSSTGKATTARTGFCSINGGNWIDVYTSNSTSALLAAGEIRIGTGYAGTVESGNIAICLAYSKLLTNDEILQNYNALKWRFGH